MQPLSHVGMLNDKTAHLFQGTINIINILYIQPTITFRIGTY